MRSGNKHDDSSVIVAARTKRAPSSIAATLETEFDSGDGIEGGDSAAVARLLLALPATDQQGATISGA